MVSLPVVSGDEVRRALSRAGLSDDEFRALL